MRRAPPGPAGAAAAADRQRGGLYRRRRPARPNAALHLLRGGPGATVTSGTDPRRAGRGGPRGPREACRKPPPISTTRFSPIFSRARGGARPAAGGAAPRDAGMPPSSRCCSARRCATRGSSRCSTRWSTFSLRRWSHRRRRRPIPEATSPPKPLPCDPAGPLCALAFKVVADEGRKLTYLRIYSAAPCEPGDQVLNAGRGRRGAGGAAVPHARPSPRTARRGPRRGHRRRHRPARRADRRYPLRPRPPAAPRRADRPRAGRLPGGGSPRASTTAKSCLPSLEKLQWEDPTFRVQEDAETGQTILTGMGELHLEVVTARLDRDFGVQVKTGRPQVVYRETLSRAVERREVFDREIDGRLQARRGAAGPDPAASAAAGPGRSPCRKTGSALPARSAAGDSAPGPGNGQRRRRPGRLPADRSRDAHRSRSPSTRADHGNRPARRSPARPGAGGPGWRRRPCSNR